MSTNIKGGSFGREKKGTCPSSTTLNKKPSSSTTIASSSSSPSPSPSSPTAGKPVPNYLKPTISSNLDFSRLPKKSALDPSVQKPVLNRRRSFDRPPLAPSSPGIGGREVRHVRSTSFSHTAGTGVASSTRPAIERVYGRASSTLRDTKVVEPFLSKSRTLKKSLLSSSSPKKGTKTVLQSVPSESRVGRDDHDHASSAQLGVDDDFVGINSEVDSLSEISEMPNCNLDLGDPSILDIEVKSRYIGQVEERGLRLDHKPETIADLLNLEVAGETKGASNVKQTETLTNENNEKLVLETKDMDENTSDSDPSASAGASGDAPARERADAQNAAAGKKEKQEYNDVIEETATKLMGGKKNKVLALAGAFETVISLQDTTNKESPI
ncbi:hypothetical protein RND81_03G116000 [Saponaria officinalis]|uniref:Calmodulin-binding domain-containing protein n=1 Tax=Saponaria officinalis TaxID=3572 RepID=A0AAW1LZP0_SAPOF